MGRKKSTETLPEKWTLQTILFSIWFVGSMVGIVYFMLVQMNIIICMMLMGNLFFGCGIRIIIDKYKKKEKDIGPFVFMFVGSILIIGGGFILWGTDKSVEMVIFLVPVFICSLFILIGLFFALNVFINNHACKKRCTERIQVRRSKIKIVDAEEDLVNPETNFLPVYSYTYKGRRYKTDISDFSSESDDLPYIFINPDKPKEYYKNGHLEALWIYIVGGITIAIGIVIICFYIKGTI